MAADDGDGLSSGIVFLLSRMSPFIRKRAEPAVCDVDPLDIAAAIREGLLVRDPDLAIGLAHRSFGDAFTVNQVDTPREKEGLQ